MPLAAALALVAVALIVAAALAPNAEAPSGVGADATPTTEPTATTEPTQTATPTASPEGPAEPEWLAGLVEDVRKACGDEEAEDAAAEMSTMSRGQARKHARDLTRECKKDRDGERPRSAQFGERKSATISPFSTRKFASTCIGSTPGRMTVSSAM